MPPTPRSGGAKAKANSAPGASTPATGTVDASALAGGVAGPVDAASAEAPPAPIFEIGTELLCDPFENGAAVLGTVSAIDGQAVELHLAELDVTWPVGLDRIDVAAGTWTHVAEDYPVPGSDLDFDTARRPWLASKPAAAVEEQPVIPTFPSSLDALTALTAALVGDDGTPVVVPLATTPPHLATPEPIAALAGAIVDVTFVETPSGVGASTPIGAPASAPPANHPGDGWALCRVNGPGSVSGDWIVQHSGAKASSARPGDVGYFSEATLKKFASIGHGDLLTRL